MIGQKSTDSEEGIMKAMGYKYWPTAVIMTVLLAFAPAAKAVDDDTPFFAGDTGLPNVMFIFDNSDSMQDVPYPRKDGSPLRPSWRWRYGVYVDPDGTIAEDENGNVKYNYTAYTSRDVEVSIPGKTPPPMPRTDGKDPSLTSTVTKIYRYHYWYRIYDENLDWDAIEAGWPENYRYHKIMLEDPGGGNPQIRTICSYSKGGKYWYVYSTAHTSCVQEGNFDYSAGVDTATDSCYVSDSGWCTTYDNTNPFTYTIISGSPGEVTFPYLRTDSHHGQYVRDANVDWSAIDDDTWNANYKNRLLVVTAGTNAGESRRISWRSQSGKYWYVDPGFPEDCDYTTRYKIVGSADDDRYAYGGNHPASKLYQAKQAMNQFLDSDAISTCKETDEQGNCIKKEYLLNLGFATYMSARIPRVRAKYYRKETYDIPDRCRAFYWRWRDTSSDFYDTDGPENGYDIEAWGTEYNDVEIGDQIDRAYETGRCWEQTIHYTVAEIEPSPTDSLPDRYRIRLRSRQGYPNEGGYKYYNWVYFDVPEGSDCTYCDTFEYPNPYDDGTYTWTLASECCPAGCTTYQYGQCYPPGCEEGGQGWYYRLYTWKDTYGDYGITDPSEPKYINPTTLMVTPYRGYDYGGKGWNATDDDLDEDDGDWILVTEDNAKYDVPINSSGDLGDIEPNTFDFSYFRYPGEGTADRPHAWSYRKTSNPWVYQYSTWKNKSTWGNSIQNDPFFPASVGDENANHTGDDQVVFVNLPEYNEDADHKGDDIDGINIAKIRNYVNLSRVTYPYDSRYDCTMMPYNTMSLAVNSSQAVAGKGTPLAASLENAKKYYESYFAQDAYTQGGCRDNYVILLTDGLETCDGDPVAAAQALLNLSVNERPTPVKTYVIGFGMGTSSQAALNALAAAGGTEHAYFATDVEELVNVLTEEIVSDIVGGSYTRASPVVTRKVEASDQLRIYTSYFDYPVWRGHLKAFNVNSDGSIGDPIAEWTGDCDGEEGNDGDAGCEMKEHGRGTVYTTVSGEMIEFSTANLAALKPLVNPEGADIDGNGTPDENADAQAVIGYTLDPGYDNGKYVGTRDPDWPLGDIYHSAPVVVTKPNLPLTDDAFPGYSDFKSAHSDRPTVVYFGANDGMLHAIDASNGREKWAYIPHSVLGKLHEFKEGHRFTVDLSVKAADIDHCSGHCWETILVGGLRKGGDHYFALDVTNPDDPQPLWEMTDNNMGQTWSVPAFGRININGTNTYVIFVGGGFSSSENKGNRLYILEAYTGQILKEITVGSSTNNVPSEILVTRYLLDGSGHPVDYRTRATVDSKLKGNIEVAYFGDTAGTLWKLKDLNADADWNPTLEALFVPSNPRPIYHRPAVADVYENCTRRFILFGTGDEQDPTNGETYDYFYEVEDRELEEGETSSDRMTWMKALAKGEKVFSDPVTYRNVVYFTAYQPTGACNMGFSYLYGLTTSECGSEIGGEGGIQYGITGDLLSPPKEKVELGRSYAPTPAIAPPGLYIPRPPGKPLALKVPVDPAKLLYWREVD